MVHRDHEIPPGAVAAVTTADTLVDDTAEAVQVDGEDAVYLPPYKQEEQEQEQIIFPAHIKDNNTVVEILMKKQQRG